MDNATIAVWEFQANALNRYFPTVYEPTVFENYVHGTTDDCDVMD